MAAGDITLTTPISLAVLRADRIVIERTHVTVEYFDANGHTARTVFRNGISRGFTVSGGNIVETTANTPTGFTDARNALTLTNAKVTALTNLARTTGLLPAGTVE